MFFVYLFLLGWLVYSTVKFSWNASFGAPRQQMQTSQIIHHHTIVDKHYYFVEQPEEEEIVVEEDHSKRSIQAIERLGV